MGYITDDFANTIDNCLEIPQSPTNSGIIALTNGLIHSDNDVDLFRISLTPGVLEVIASNAPASPMLKIRLSLILPDQVTTNTVSDPLNRLSASISTNLATGGTYYLKVEGVGTTTDTNTTNGFVGYGSIGQYALSGSFRNLPRPPGDFFAQPILLPSLSALS